MATCDRSHHVNPYHDGELPDGERASFDEHLRRCPACALELERLRRLSRFVRATPPELPPGLFPRLHGSLGATRERVVLHTAELLAVAAALVLAVCAGWAVRGGLLRARVAVPPAPWEMAAVAPRADAVPMMAEEQFARAMVDALSAENGHD